MNNINENVELALEALNAITKGAIGIGLLDAILLAFIILNFCHIR